MQRNHRRPGQGGTGSQIEAGAVEGAGNLPGHDPAGGERFAQMRAVVADGDDVSAQAAEQNVDTVDFPHQTAHALEIG